MKMMFVGSESGGDPGFVKWYLGVVHHATPIERVIFMTPAVSGDYKAAKEWAMEYKINHVEYPNPEVKFIEKNEDDIDLCMCFKASYVNGRISSRIRNIAVDKEIPLLELPQDTGK